MAPLDQLGRGTNHVRAPSHGAVSRSIPRQRHRRVSYQVQQSLHQNHLPRLLQLDSREGSAQLESAPITERPEPPCLLLRKSSEQELPQPAPADLSLYSRPLMAWSDRQPCTAAASLIRVATRRALADRSPCLGRL